MKDGVTWVPDSLLERKLFLGLGAAVCLRVQMCGCQDPRHTHLPTHDSPVKEAAALFLKVRNL